MSVDKLNIYNAVNAYSKQISLNSLVQKKSVAMAMALRSLVGRAILEDGDQQCDDVNQEVEGPDEG